MPKINPLLEAEAINCIGYGHLIIRTTMFHHLYENECDCMCDKLTANHRRWTA